MPLYQIKQQKTQQVKPASFKSEKELQNLFEENLEDLLGVRFIGTEFTTGDRQRGRIDTLGIDQDGTPVIIEYKKTGKDNVINQGLFYLDWLVDHKGDFTIAAQEQLGKSITHKLRFQVSCQGHFQAILSSFFLLVTPGFTLTMKLSIPICRKSEKK
jgi:RecB family endonuclease NucS